MFTTKVITVKISAGQSSFTVPINIPHPVKDMNIKSLIFTNTGTVTNTDIIEVRSSITGEVFFSFPDAVSIMELNNTPFTINRTHLQGNHTFELLLDGAPFMSDGEMSMSMTLCFVEN